MADIHSFESLAAVDGEGIRFDIFFTGCPLRCVYCHNPDTRFGSGKDYTAEEVFNKAKRFKPYFRNGGGVTFSGGEPLLNAEFINELAPMLKSENIGCCIDTSGSVKLNDSVKKAIDGADMVILDLKFHNPESYKKYTGGEFENFIETGDYCTKTGKRLWLRTVIVPGINDTKEDIDQYALLAKRFNFEKYELLPFHTMGFFKYENLGIENPLEGTPPLSPEKLTELRDYLNSII
ncbi:MAG: pyruvate formate lyase-activating protein [Clostridia bacterium]|nr:pyruvate formate lyase-activating protein [Clostridia bacterium]